MERYLCALFLQLGFPEFSDSVALFVLLPYIVRRVMLLVLPFLTLRALPPEAYQSVHWTEFIPHL
jgi:hypothetical protein